MEETSELGNVRPFIVNKAYFCPVYVDDIKLAGKKRNLAQVWKKLMKNVDIDEPTSFHDHVHLACIQRECKPNETIIEQFSEMFESLISAGATENLPRRQKPHAQTVAWSYDMANWQTRKWSNCTKFQDGRQFKQEELESVGELSEVCSHIVLKCLYLARIGRPDILWSVNKSQGSVTKNGLM